MCVLVAATASFGPRIVVAEEVRQSAHFRLPQGSNIGHPVRFGLGSRFLAELPEFGEASDTRRSGLALAMDLVGGRYPASVGASRRLDSVFSRRIRAELDFYGLVSSRFSEDEFDYDADNWSASVVLRVPVTALDLYGKFGAIHQTNGANGYVASRRYLNDGSASYGSWSSTDGFASIGAELRLKFFNLFGEYMRIDSPSEEQSDTFSTGIRFRF